MKFFAELDLAGKLKSTGSMYSVLVYLQDQLKALDVTEMNGIQIKTLLQQEGWEINANGVVTPSDVASRLRQYGLVCTGTPGAAGARSTPILIGERWWVAILLKIRLDTIWAEDRMLFKIKKEDDSTRLAVYLNQDYGVKCDLGVETYEQSFGADLTEFFTTAVVGEWFDVGMVLDFSSEKMFGLFNGVAGAEIPFTPADIPTATSETVEIGCANTSVAMAQMIGGFAPLWQQQLPFHPFPRQRLPLAMSYYDCRPGAISNRLYDRAVESSNYRCDLTITNGAIAEVEMI